MAGIFNIFSEQENSPLAFNNNKTPFKMKTGNAEILPTKMLFQSQTKSKGLSMRSKSDLNVSASKNFGVNKLNPKDCKMTMKDKQCLAAKSLSPMKLLSPKKKIENYAITKLSPKISSPIMQNVPDNFLFRKPATPKNLKKIDKYPEIEKLAYYIDPNELLDHETKYMFEEDVKLLKSFHKSNDSIISIEDDSGFISDNFEHSTDISVSLPSLSDIELPDISDLED